MIFMPNLAICWMVASCIDCGTSEARRWGDLLWWCASKCLHGRDQHSSIVRRGSSLGLLHQDKTLVAYSILQLYTLLTAWNCHDHVCLLLVLNIFDVFVSCMCAHVSVHTILSLTTSASLVYARKTPNYGTFRLSSLRSKAIHRSDSSVAITVGKAWQGKVPNKSSP